MSALGLSSQAGVNIRNSKEFSMLTSLKEILRHAQEENYTVLAAANKAVNADGRIQLSYIRTAFFIHTVARFEPACSSASLQHRVVLLQ